MIPEPTGSAQATRRERRYRRFKLQYPVHLVFPPGELISEAEAVTRDVSIVGLLLDCPVSTAKGTAVSFVIHVKRPALRQIDLMGDGIVVRVERDVNEVNFLLAVECKDPITHLDDYLPYRAL